MLLPVELSSATIIISMSATSSLAQSYKLQSFVHVLHRSCRSHYSPSPPHSMNRGLHLLGNNNWVPKQTQFTINKHIVDAFKSPPFQSPPPPPPPPKRFNFFGWARWILGSMLTMFLPFWKQKFDKIKKIEGEAELVVEEVEYVAEVVENAASAVEKLSEEMVQKIPDNHDKLKRTALLVERISKATAQDAQLTLNILHKVDDLKEDVNELETLVKPIVDKIVHKKSEEK